MKSLLGGSSALAGTAILSSFLLFTAKPSLAETFLYQVQQSKSESTQTQNSTQRQNSTQSHSTEPQNSTKPQNSTQSHNSTQSQTSILAPSEDDSQPETPKGAIIDDPNEPLPISEPVSYVATAYSLRGKTASGRYVSPGIIAADPRILPLGSRVRLEAGRWSGEYVVADTGGRIKGRKIDIWTPTSREALRFGRRIVKLTILSYGGKRSAAKKRVRT